MRVKNPATVQMIRDIIEGNTPPARVPESENAANVTESIGGAPLVSINLGEKNIDAAKKVIANCFVYILALAVPVTVLAYIFRRPILLTFGATEAVYPYAETYFSLYLIGTVFALTATGMNQLMAN